MTNAASVSYLTPRFDDFLFARINEEGDATPLSVLSVLARLGVDPWEEAAKLAQLPRGSAAQELVAFFAATPGAPPAYLNAQTVCDRLIDLLPPPAGATIPPLKELGIRSLTKSRFMIGLAVIAVILVIQLIVSRQATIPANDPHATSSSAVMP
jgi:hypothetical protein